MSRRNRWEAFADRLPLILLYSVFAGVLVVLGAAAFLADVPLPPKAGITFEFGGCSWSPPSPKAAGAFIEYFYGIGAPLVLPSEFEEAIEEQLVAAGMPRAQAKLEMKWLDHCMAQYVVPARDRGL